MKEMKDSRVEWIGEIPQNKEAIRNKYIFSYEKGKLPISTNLEKYGARAGLCGTHKQGKISSTVVRIRGNEAIYQPFLYWYYKGFENYMFQSVNGTTIPHMNKKYIEMMGWINWTIPPKSEQNEIVVFLDKKCRAIDNVVEIKQKVIDRLIAYKKSLIYEVVTGKKEI